MRQDEDSERSSAKLEQMGRNTLSRMPAQSYFPEKRVTPLLRSAWPLCRLCKCSTCICLGPNFWSRLITNHCHGCTEWKPIMRAWRDGLCSYSHTTFSWLTGRELWMAMLMPCPVCQMIPARGRTPHHYQWRGEEMWRSTRQMQN